MNTLPDKPGYYWWNRGTPDSEWLLCQVDYVSGGGSDAWYAAWPGLDSNWWFDDWEKSRPIGEWIPVQPPHELSREQILLLGMAIKMRFRCKKIATKPDAHSWSVEQDFLNGAETILKMQGRELPRIIRHCQETKRSATMLTPSEIADFPLAPARKGE